MLNDVTVVVPAYNAETTISKCLKALLESKPAPVDILVYDDGSMDRTPEIAKSLGARVISGRANAGPAVGRNRGALCSSSDIVIFVDADVVVQPNALSLLAEALCEPDTKAAFGTYTEWSTVSNLAGRYANLRHHHTHCEASRRGEEPTTFWSGLGAVDRLAFLSVGGFDKSYARPCIEDVELGLRLHRAEWNISIVPEARGEHLKNWTLRSLWETDIRYRAIPWSKLIVSGRIGQTLNTSATEKVKALLALAALGSAALAAFAGPSLLWLALVFFSGFVIANRDFLCLLFRSSLGVGCIGIMLHLLYYCYAAGTFVSIAGFLLFKRRLTTIRQSFKHA